MSAPVIQPGEPGGLAGHLDGFVRAVREAGILVLVDHLGEVGILLVEPGLRLRVVRHARRVRRGTDRTSRSSVSTSRCARR